MNNIIDWYILLLVTNNGDGFKKNFYMYRQDENSKFRIATWDYDHSFGRDGDNEPHTYGVLDMRENTLFNRFLNNFIYVDRLKNRYKDLVQKGILTEENLLKMVDENYFSIQNHIKKNELRWGIDNEIYYYDDVDSEKEIQTIKKWIPLQLHEIQKYIEEL